MSFSNEELTYISSCIQNWIGSNKRRMQVIGENYYLGIQDILAKERFVIEPETHKKVTMENVPNNRVVNNLYSFCVDQKAAYIFSKPFKINTPNETYADELGKIFNPKFRRTIKSLGKNTFNCGLGWLYPMVDGDNLVFKPISATEVLPFWKDADHTELEYAVRLYTVLDPAKDFKTKDKVEIFTRDGVEYYIWDGAKLFPEDKPKASYMTISYVNEYSQRIEVGMNWDRIPLIPFRYNSQETPLISRVKSLQDGINSMMSIFQDNLSEDMRSTVLVIQNYDGEDVGNFRRNLAATGVVKVSSVDGVNGGVDALRIEVDSNNYEVVLKELKRALFNGARCFDPSDELMSSRPNEINLEALYFTINLDANEMEQEFLASFEDVKWFIDTYLKNKNVGDFSNVPMDLKFARDAIIDESAKIDSFVKAFSFIPMEIAYKNMPWIEDVNKALDEYKKEEAEREAKAMIDGMEGLGNGSNGNSKE